MAHQGPHDKPMADGSVLGKMIIPIEVRTEPESAGFERRPSDVVGEAARVYGFQTPVKWCFDA